MGISETLFYFHAGFFKVVFVCVCVVFFVFVLN
jgi:hypothetical protein